MGSRAGSALTAVTGLVVAFALLAPGASGQSLGPGDPVADYVRILETTGHATWSPAFFRPADPAGVQGAAAHPWAGHPLFGGSGARDGAPRGAAFWGEVTVRPTGARLRTFVNSGHPFGWNDGLLWQGKGVSAAFDAGGELRWRGVTARLHPEVTWAQNADYDFVPAGFDGFPEVAYPWRVIDLPQRPGTGAAHAFSLGDSEVRLDARGVTLGVGTRQRWWGPGVRNAILLSDNAPGFVHGFVGTRRPVSVGIGDIEAFYLYGGLRQSDWFDEARRGNERYLTGWVLGFAPDWPRGLSVGMARMMYGLVPDGGRSVGDLLIPFGRFLKKTQVTPDNPLGDDEEDQLASLFLRWVIPDSGFEVYVEWSRTDHAWDFRDLILEPEHAQGRTLGLRHVSDVGDGRWLALGLEVTDLAKTTTSRVRDNPTYYEHWIVTQGYTHRGQLLGASVGPGGSAQSITADLFAPWGRAGLLLERRVHDNDAYYYLAEQGDVDWCCHDASFSVGPRGILFHGPFELGGEAAVTRELNRYFRRGNDVWNLRAGVDVRWRGW